MTQAVAAASIKARHGLWRSLVSASVWGTEGREFKSPQPDPSLVADCLLGGRSSWAGLCERQTSAFFSDGFLQGSLPGGSG